MCLSQMENWQLVLDYQRKFLLNPIFFEGEVAAVAVVVVVDDSDIAHAHGTYSFLSMATQVLSASIDVQ